MKIDDQQSAVIAGLRNAAGGATRPASDDYGFASALKTDALKAQTLAKRDALLAGQQPAKPKPYAEDIARIREHGLSAYAEEERERKLQELREKILEAMGLTEDDLADLPADRRAVIERMIADEIRARTTAETAIDGNREDGDGETAAGKAARTVSAGPAAAGEALMAARDTARAEIRANKDDSTG